MRVYPLIGSYTTLYHLIRVWKRQGGLFQTRGGASILPSAAGCSRGGWEGAKRALLCFRTKSQKCCLKNVGNRSRIENKKQANMSNIQYILSDFKHNQPDLVKDTKGARAGYSK